eukprot:CAMPEP_0172185438 /NCGR_PEP_ID=MMETSP1050-20130122/20167_1 /TAXON_ID=233186 /ORGANISM="Cryptomonas curvata, Strain CCAP979/52" /LENGTH=237 /DNA_ID=CAMNT_0012859419 /DNA_START=143 /DNA_END=856 /DNA_ORIENTATION=+
MASGEQDVSESDSDLVSLNSSQASSTRCTATNKIVRRKFSAWTFQLTISADATALNGGRDSYSVPLHEQKKRLLEHVQSRILNNSLNNQARSEKKQIREEAREAEAAQLQAAKRPALSDVTNRPQRAPSRPASDTSSSRGSTAESSSSSYASLLCSVSAGPSGPGPSPPPVSGHAEVAQRLACAGPAGPALRTARVGACGAGRAACGVWQLWRAMWPSGCGPGGVGGGQGLGVCVTL